MVTSCFANSMLATLKLHWKHDGKQAAAELILINLLCYTREAHWGETSMKQWCILNYPSYIYLLH